MVLFSLFTFHFSFLLVALFVNQCLVNGALQHFPADQPQRFTEFLSSPAVSGRTATKMLGPKLESSKLAEIAASNLGTDWSSIVHGSVQEFYTQFTDGLQPETTGYAGTEMTQIQASFYPGYMLLAFEDACATYKAQRDHAASKTDQAERDRVFQKTGFPIFKGYSGDYLMVNAKTGAVHAFDPADGLYEDIDYESISKLITEVLQKFEDKEYIMEADGGLAFADETEEDDGAALVRRKRFPINLGGLTAGLNARLSTTRFGNLATQTVKNSLFRPYTKKAAAKRARLIRERRNQMNFREVMNCMAVPNKFLTLNCALMPNTCAGIEDAITLPCNKPRTLTYMGVPPKKGGGGGGGGGGTKKRYNDPLKDQNRYYACGRAKIAIDKKFIIGLTCDEYPFASTFEGGLGAYVNFVSSIEAGEQAGQLGRFYAKHRKECKAFKFRVMPVLGITDGLTGFCPSELLAP